jgi:hypothetical protein
LSWQQFAWALLYFFDDATVACLLGWASYNPARGMPAERNNRINGASFLIELAHMALLLTQYCSQTPSKSFFDSIGYQLPLTASVGTSAFPQLADLI